MAGVDNLAKSTLHNQGVSGGLFSEGNQSSRNIYPAIVVSNSDPMGMKRVVARIISINDNDEIIGGRDRDTPDEELPFCVPMIPNHFHIIPLVGEMIYVFLENPTDNSAPRYYMGSQINSPFKLKFQSFSESNKVFNYTNFNLNISKEGNIDATSILPKEGDIAIQGRSDSDLILKPREVFLVAGKFKKGTFEFNTETPSSLQIIQKENLNSDLLDFYSQLNATSTNINLYSNRGKFRDPSISNFEINEDLKSFGELANSLHPAVFGDELIRLLDLIIKVLINHIHTPQKPALTTPELKELSSYTVDGNLQKIISNHIRIN